MKTLSASPFLCLPVDSHRKMLVTRVLMLANTNDWSSCELLVLWDVMMATWRQRNVGSTKAPFDNFSVHDDVIKWKHFPRYWPFVRGIRRSPVNSPHKGQWRRALMFPLICVWINGWVSNREAGDLRRFRAHSDVTVMISDFATVHIWSFDSPGHRSSLGAGSSAPPLNLSLWNTGQWWMWQMMAVQLVLHWYQIYNNKTLWV